jgi:hypothetical protein
MHILILWPGTDRMRSDPSPSRPFHAGVLPFCLPVTEWRKPPHAQA